MGSDGTWQQPRRSDYFDVVMTAVLSAWAAVSLYMGGDPALMGDDWADYSRPFGIALVAGAILPLALRRRFPVSVLVAITTAYSLQVLFEIPEQTVAVAALFIAFYTVGAYGEGGRNITRSVAAVTILGLIVLAATEIDTTEFMDELRELDTFVPAELFLAFYVFQNTFYFAGAWMMGDVMRSRRQRELELEATTHQLQRAQAENERRAVLEERMHIARELHDVVAHHVAVMGVQAGAARRVLDSQPDAVPDLLSTVEASSREAVEELQRMLGVLRREDGAEPTLAQLEVLVEQMRRAGLRLGTNLDETGGERREGLPHGVDRVGYRIVQEALTNTIKHAGPTAEVWLSLVRATDVLEIQVTDDGASGGASAVHSEAAGAVTVSRTSAPPEANEARSGGHGLEGMRERVEALGGRLAAGPRAEGGFEVRAHLPLTYLAPPVSSPTDARAWIDSETG